MKNFDILLRSGKTIFGYQNISLLLGTQNNSTLKSFIQRAVKQGLLQKLANGIYGLYSYDFHELAASLRSRSYISLYTILQYDGISSQNSTTPITLVSNNTLSKNIVGREITFYKIKDSILLNPIGINYTGKYMIASRERAICDIVYLFGECSTLNVSDLDLAKLENIANIYNKTTISYIKKIIQNATKN